MPVSRPVQPNPEAARLVDMASAALNAGKLNDAEAILNHVLQAYPDNADALSFKAYIYSQRRQFDVAYDLIRHAIALNPGNGLYYLTAAMIAKGRRHFDEMEALLLKALELNPREYIAQIYTNLGDCMQEKRNMPAAIAYFSKAIEKDPRNGKAYFFRGMSRYEMEGMSERVEHDARRGIEISPRPVDMLCKFAGIYTLSHNFEKARELLERAVALDPNHEEALFYYATCYQERGDIERARQIFDDLLKKHPQSARAAVGEAFLLPVIPADNADIERWRERFTTSLQRLIDTQMLVREPERQGFYLPFYQGYHGRDNKEMMQLLSRFFLTCCPAVRYTAPHCNVPPKADKKIRVGFVSEFFHSKLLTQFFGPLIEGLAADDRFEVVVIAYSPRANEKVKTLSDAVQKYVVLPISLPAAQQVVAQQEIDILIYLDIGLRLPSYMLALARLAPIQAVMGGHPLTTGIPTMDYFFTTGSMEAEGAEAHYTEKLLAGANLLAVVKKDFIPPVPMTREELGLPGGDVRLYTCPVLLFKLHPDMDKIFAGILRKDPKARIILFDSGKIVWRQLLEKRFAASIGADADRVVFVPFAPADKFIHAMRAMDCIFDTLHFSFGTTAFQLLGSEVPFVTMPGEFLRGRGAYGLFKIMELEELAAHTPEAYVSLILKLAQDKAFYKAMQEKIRERSDHIFDDYSPVDEFKNHMARIYKDICVP